MRTFNNVFGFDAILKKTDTKDPETGSTIKGIETIIKCHKFGKTISVREGQGYINVSAMCYLFPAGTDIKKDYILDNQPVRIINEYTIPKGRRRKAEKKLLEVYTYA